MKRKQLKKRFVRLMILLFLKVLECLFEDPEIIDSLLKVLNCLSIW
jgi:hypothetical protein